MAWRHTLAVTVVGVHGARPDGTLRCVEDLLKLFSVDEACFIFSGTASLTAGYAFLSTSYVFMMYKLVINLSSLFQFFSHSAV